MERHLGERCIDLRAGEEAETAMKKYEIDSGGDDEDNDEAGVDDISNAFANVSLDLNINRYSRVSFYSNYSSFSYLRWLMPHSLLLLVLFPD